MGADETSDLSRVEQISICIRIVDNDLLINEYFMEFCTTPNTKAQTLYDQITDFLKKAILNSHDLKYNLILDLKKF